MESTIVQAVDTIKATFNKRQKPKLTTLDIQYWAKNYFHLKEEDVLIFEVVDRYTVYLQFVSEEVCRRYLELHIGTYTVVFLDGSETTVTVTPVEPENEVVEWHHIYFPPLYNKRKAVPDCTSQIEETTRSQSTSRVAKSPEVAGLKVAGAKRSASVTRNETDANSGKTKSQGAVKKKNKTSDLATVFSKDLFLDCLDSIKKEKGIPTMSEEQFWVKQREALQSLLKEGSELKLNKLDRKAVDKYKTALSMILDHSLKAFRLTEIDFIVLKYSISTCLLELSAYSDIIKAIECLTEIQANAKAFPAVYYGLGKAYKQLNRFKTAVEHLEKGSAFLKREVKFETQSWPETNVVIPETTREGLEDLIDKMLRECTSYHEPDAICKYSKCRDISSHILPSEHIFFSDPEFAGYVIVSCEEKCRVEYHLSCWRDYKEKVTDDIGKHNDKVLIGQNCPTADCFSKPNVRSVINKIEIVGEDGSIKSTVEPPKGENSTVVKEKILSKKKKPDVVVPQPKTKAPKKPKKPLEVVKPVVIQETPPDNTAKELEERLEKLSTLRDLNFGSLQESNWDPRRMYFGNLDVQNLDHFLSPEYAEETEKDRMEKEFVFSYIYEYLRQYGPQKMDDVEKKWKAEHDDFNLGKMLSSSENVCPFLLKSYRFAAVEDYICVSEQLPNAYKMAKAASVEAVTDILTKINNVAESTGVTKERKLSFSDELKLLLEGVHETETCNFENFDFRSEIAVQSENQLIPNCDINDDDLHVAEMIQEEYEDRKEYSENTSDAEVEPTTPTQLTDDEQDILQTEGHINFKTSGSSSPVNLCPVPADEKLIAVDVATATDAEWGVTETSHQAIQTEEYIDPELVKYTTKMEELSKAQEKAKKQSDEHIKKEKQQKQVIEKLLHSTAELEKELNKLKLLKADEATALKETIAQKTKEIETLKKKLSLEKASCEELKNRISEIICETGKKSDLLKACEEQRSQLRALAIKAVQERGDMKISSSKQKCHDRLQILRCMLTSAEANTEKKTDILSDIKSWEAYLLKVKEYASKFSKLRNELETDIFSTDFEALEDLKFPEEPNCFYSTLEEMIIWITSDDNKQKSEEQSGAAEIKHPEQKPSVNNLNNEGRTEINMENYNRNQHMNMPPPPLVSSQMYNKFGNLAGPPVFQQHMQNMNPIFGAPPQTYYYPSNMNYRTSVPMMNMQPQTPRSHPPAHNSWMHKDNWAPPSKEKQEADSKPAPVAQIPKTVTPPVVQPNTSLMGSKKENEPPAEKKSSLKPPDKIATPPLLPVVSKESGPPVSVPPLKPVNNLQPNTVQKTVTTAAPNATVTGVPTAPASNSYGKLMKHLHRHFPARTEEELTECVTIARQRNNNSLSQLKMTTITNMIDKILKEKAAKKQGVTTLEKFGGSAWGEVRTDTVSTWSKSQDEVEECIICTDSLKDNKVQLQCKHTFHSKCIKTWLRTNSICPICREFTRLVDEYPPLA